MGSLRTPMSLLYAGTKSGSLVQEVKWKTKAVYGKFSGELVEKDDDGLTTHRRTGAATLKEAAVSGKAIRRATG